MAKDINSGALTIKQIESFEKDFQTRPENKIMMNAVTRGNIQEIAINRQVINQMDLSFSNEVESGGPITDQMQAGTCWLFAELNWLRTLAIKKMKAEKFEFSQNYIIFWNKLEKSNYFLENMIEYRDKPWDDRRVYHLINIPVPDGGEWHMAADIIDKYGIVPKSAMPDTFNREKSKFLNEMLFYKLREGAAKLRAMHEEGKPVSALRKEKMEIMKLIYRILAIMLGEPPRKFDFGFRDKDKKYHRSPGITPKQFFKKYVGINTADIYCLLSCPTPDTPYYKTFTAEFFANTIGGREMIALNVPNNILLGRAIQVLKSGEACLFSADVLQHSHSKEGLLDTGIYDYDLIFNTPFKMDKITRIQTLQTRLTHCMVLVGVDLVNGKPVKWKVENSWGESVGKKGIFIMSENWFDEHVYALIIHKKFLTKKMLQLFKQPPISLPPWHPMI
ncbi:MAG: hypothetical protein A2161_09535 [Candidatus Schekmanbacteria bacterium RBG_13_48_7]|uniref:Aminopeptidase n=1 Tax=Candidatus Schekmanbacteria bacterium RBG_13_48_7 TaxID=1817878 RepID=A0A1F7RX17_9BACT|nr:MAG: hypothetical protein A2161_09535 [Candidatus Schekmanbacteria bacterium RBG_13_48_7]